MPAERPTVHRGLFVAEGSSDAPIAAIVEGLFLRHECTVSLTSPDFAALKVAKDVRSRLTAGANLIQLPLEVVVVHRDADRAGHQARLDEIESAVPPSLNGVRCVPVVPVRMTEAWLLLNEEAIRMVAGNPRGRNDLSLPKPVDVENLPDPKATLAAVLLEAANVTGRRRDRLSRRFSQNRRQLLERLDPAGAVQMLPSWQRLVERVGVVAQQLRTLA